MHSSFDQFEYHHVSHGTSYRDNRVFPLLASYILLDALTQSGSVLTQTRDNSAQVKAPTHAVRKYEQNTFILDT